MRIVSIFLRHGTEKYSDADKRAGEYFQQRFPEVEHDMVIADMSLQPGSQHAIGHGETLLGACNSFSEFSGADSAIRQLDSRIWSYDLVHIVTSAFEALYTGYLERFHPAMLQAIVGCPACVGHIDCYNQPINFLSYHSQHWIRTSFFFLPPAELKALGSLVSFRDARRIFSGDPAQPFRDDAPLSPNYRSYIYDWLTGGDIGQGVSWHSASQLTPENLPEFERKAMAVLNEHMLSIRLRALGCRLLDTTWMADQLASNSPINWRMSWREQLAARSVDAVILKDPPA